MRVTKLLGWFGVTALVVALALIFSMLGTGQAQAAPVAPVPALVPCPPGAPPMSSLCSPAGWALAIEAGTATTSQAAAAGVAGYASTAASAATVSGGPAALAAGTALTVGINEFVGGTATVDTTMTDLFVFTSDMAGWANGNVTYAPGANPVEVVTSYDPATRTSTTVVIAMEADWVGLTDSEEVLERSQNYMASGTDDSLQLKTQCFNASGGLTWQVTNNVGGNWMAGGVGTGHKTFSTGCPSGTTNVRVDFPITGQSYSQGLQWFYQDFVVEVEDVGMTGDMVTEYTCRDAAGVESVGSVMVAVASNLPEVPVEIPAVECPAGSVLVGLTVTWVTTDGEQVLYDYTAPEWVYDIPVEYPGCVGGECTIQLWRIFSDGAPAEWCGVAGVGCQYWWSDANKAQNYECRYGAYTVELGLCAIYRKPGSVSQNAPVIYDPSGRPIGIGQPVISTDPDDFKIFEPVPGPEPDPPVPGPEPEPVPQSGECFPSGWGVFNPVEWVYRPVVCALSWAYVPPPGSLDGSIERVRVEVGEKPPFDLIEPGYVLVGDFMDEAQSPSCGFENFAPNVGGFNNNAAELSLACEQPAPMQGVYMVTQVLIWLFALFAAVKMIRRSVGSQD